MRRSAALQDAAPGRSRGRGPVVRARRVDEVDKGIIEALQRNGREPFRRIAARLGVSEATIRARYARLRDDHILQVTGVTNPLGLGFEAQAMVGIRTSGPPEPVAEAIWRRLPATAVLAFSGMALWLLVGIPLGVLTARYRDKPIDRIVLLVSMIGVSLPVFWLARMLQYELAYRACLFPVAGFATWGHLLLPVLTLTTS